MIALRAAMADDLDAIMALEHAAFPTDAWSAEMMSAELRSEHTVYLVAVDGGDIVGYGGIRALAGDADADIQTIALAAERRGAGDGRRLLYALLRATVERRAKQVFLDVRDDNAPARGLYEAEGFVEIGRRPRYYQPDDVDAVVMRLDLTPAVIERIA